MEDNIEAKPLLERIWLQSSALWTASQHTYSKQVKEELAKAGELKNAEIVKYLEENQELEKSKKATLLAVQGLLHDIAPEYSKQGEELVLKSVRDEFIEIRLNPSDPEAFNILGHILWKKGDIEGSRNCYEESVKKCPSLKGLRYLSVILRAVDADPEQKVANIMRSLDLAKKALALNLQDGDSWYFVGNAHLAVHCLEWKGSSHLLTCIKCYNEAEKHSKYENADLFYNRAKVFEFLLEFEQSLKEYRRSYQIDPSLGGDKEATRIHDTLQNAYRMYKNKVRDLLTEGNIKPKAIEKHIKTIKTSFRPDSLFGQLQLRSVNSLVEGFNKGGFLACKICQFVSREQEVPFTMLVMDHVGDFAILYLFNSNTQILSTVPGFSDLHLIHPYVKKIVVTTDRPIAFNVIYVYEPETLYINYLNMKATATPTEFTNKVFTN